MFEEELAFANDLANLAAHIAMSLFGSADLEVRTKHDRSPVTEADTQIETIVREQLDARFPRDAVLGEEEGLSGNSDRVWIVDPIDGTKNFADGIQIWATLIALSVNGRFELGVVSAPALDERYEAVRGSGARLNGRPIRVSGVEDLSDAAVVSSGMKDWVDGPWAATYRDLVTTARRSRGFGDFWGHMLVARGAAEMMLEPSLRVWDYAAVQVIVEEAGGRVTTLEGSLLQDHGSALSTNGALHEEVAARFRSSQQRARPDGVH
jgi:histidinol-phosphatase